MPIVSKSVLVEHPASRMFELVDAVEAYPLFLPWCERARVIERDATRTRATIFIDYRGLKQSFTTENTKEPPERMTVKLVEGPFRVLDGEWRFTSLAERASRIDFRLRYEFSGTLLDALAGPVFGHIANTMVDAFVRRADALHAG